MSSLVPVVFYTQAHRIKGRVLLRERLNEALNDPLTDFLELHDVLISKLVDPDQNEVEWPTTVVPKNEVVVATLDSAHHESESTRVDKVTRKQGQQIGCIVGQIELYGTGYVTFQSAAREVLRNQLPNFFPVTDATLLFPAASDSRLDTQLALANRNEVKAFSLL